MAKKKLDQQVYEFIIQKIEAGEFLEREHITEQEIVDELGISRTPIRKAFQYLTEDGYLENIENIGVHVKFKKMNAKGFQERTEFIEKLLSYYLFNIEKKETTFQIEELESILNQMSQQMGKSDCLFEKTVILYFKELLNQMNNNYIEGAIIKALRDLFISDNPIDKILKNIREKIYQHLIVLKDYLADSNYALARREVRILLNQMKLEVIEKT